MYKLIIATTIIFSFSYCVAQSPVYPFNTNSDDIEVGAYIKDIDNQLNKYKGTWKYESEGIQIYFYVEKVVQKLSLSLSKYHYEDFIKIHFKIEENGVTIKDTRVDLFTDDFGDTYTYPNIRGNILTSKSIYEPNTPGHEFLWLGYEDQYSCFINGDVKFQVDAENPNQAVMKIWPTESWIDTIACPQYETDPNFGFTLPTVMSLTKVE